MKLIFRSYIGHLQTVFDFVAGKPSPRKERDRSGVYIEMKSKTCETRSPDRRAQNSVGDRFVDDLELLNIQEAHEL